MKVVFRRNKVIPQFAYQQQPNAECCVHYHPLHSRTHGPIRSPLEPSEPQSDYASHKCKMFSRLIIVPRAARGLTCISSLMTSTRPLIAAR